MEWLDLASSLCPRATVPRDITVQQLQEQGEALTAPVADAPCDVPSGNLLLEVVDSDGVK